mmetsp:Transcript_24730/g.41015  ORF Transcript_24730/g.41015 Transcript_24730/m.41015 type:complete len:213 (+) Transcript_24730:925-1563(+)
MPLFDLLNSASLACASVLRRSRTSASSCRRRLSALRSDTVGPFVGDSPTSDGAEQSPTTQSSPSRSRISLVLASSPSSSMGTSTSISPASSSESSSSMKSPSERSSSSEPASSSFSVRAAAARSALPDGFLLRPKSRGGCLAGGASSLASAALLVAFRFDLRGGHSAPACWASEARRDCSANNAACPPSSSSTSSSSDAAASAASSPSSSSC